MNEWGGLLSNTKFRALPCKGENHFNPSPQKVDAHFFKYVISNGNNKMVCMPNFGWGKHQWCEDGFFPINLHLSSGGFKWLTYIND